MPRYKFHAKVAGHDLPLSPLPPGVAVHVPETYLDFVVTAPSFKVACDSLADHFYAVDYLGEVP